MQGVFVWNDKPGRCLIQPSAKTTCCLSPPGLPSATISCAHVHQLHVQLYRTIPCCIQPFFNLHAKPYHCAYAGTNDTSVGDVVRLKRCSISPTCSRYASTPVVLLTRCHQHLSLSHLVSKMIRIHVMHQYPLILKLCRIFTAYA